MLHVAETNTGYWCVYKQGLYYLARMKKARLGSYATAEAAALAVARSPEGQAAKRRRCTGAAAGTNGRPAR